MSRREACSHEGKIYYEFSHWYERIFTGLLQPRITATIQSLNIPPGARVLEVGVGTGLSLAAYPHHARITAIDLAPEMLAQAQKKIEAHGWEHIQLLRMDALNMDFPDGYFDYVMAFHIVSVVADPELLIREMLRVTRPGGTLVIINHFRSEKKWLAPLVDLLDPVTRRIGWRTTLRFEQVTRGVPLQIKERFKTSPGSLFTVVIATKANGVEEFGASPCPKVCLRPPWKRRPERPPRRLTVARSVQRWAEELARRRRRKQTKGDKASVSTRSPEA